MPWFLVYKFQLSSKIIILNTYSILSFSPFAPRVIYIILYPEFIFRISLNILLYFLRFIILLYSKTLILLVLKLIIIVLNSLK